MVSSVQIACLECDLLLVPPLLAEGERASCPRCRHHLTARPRDGLLRSLAFAVSAAVLLVTALAVVDKKVFAEIAKHHRR